MRFSNIILTALAFMTLLSCRKEPQIRVEDHVRIEFSASVLTKGYIQSADDPAFKDPGIGIFGRKINEDNASEEFMTNLQVKGDASGNWNYTGDYYWGLNCQHEFLAMYPWSNTGTEVSLATVDNAKTGAKANTLYITGASLITPSNPQTTPPTGTPSGRDYMYGYQEQHFQLGDQPGKVHFIMHHVMAAVSVYIRNVSDNHVVAINDISLSGLYTKASKIGIPRVKDGVPTMDIDLGSMIAYVFPNQGDETNTAMPFIPAKGMEYQLLIGPILVIPQEFVDLSRIITLNMKVKPYAAGVPDEEQPPVKELAINLSDYKFPNIEIGKQYRYLPGYHYRYNLDITNEKVNVTVTIVPWIDDDFIELI